MNLIVSKNLDVMKNTCLATLSRRNEMEEEALGRRRKAQLASKRGSVVFYVTKRVASWNAVLRAC
jgi:hypothetical protein